MLFFFPQDHLGLKVRKASWDVMEKSAPAELKVNHKCNSPLHKWPFHTCKLLVYCFLLYIPRVEGRHRGSRSKGSKWRSRL